MPDHAIRNFGATRNEEDQTQSATRERSVQTTAEWLSKLFSESYSISLAHASSTIKKDS